MFVRPAEMPLRVTVLRSALPLSQAYPGGSARGRASLSPFMPWSLSPRLALPRKHNVSWYAARSRRNPFGPADSLGTMERDSILRVLGGEVPELAVRRGQTPSERDAGAKEAMLKMRLTGRTLLVPPDNSGGLITSSFPLTLFGVHAERARNARDNQTVDENRARLARLRQRADSLRRSMVDSLP